MLSNSATAIKPKPSKQILIAVTGGMIVVLFLAMIKGCQIYRAIQEHSNFAPPPEAVTSTTVQAVNWKETIMAVGTLESPQGAILSAESAGRVSAIHVQSGERVKAGTVLVELDAAVERADLIAARATRDDSARVFERSNRLRATNTIPQSEYDDAHAKYLTLQARVEALEATIERRKVVAPYDGLLGIRTVSVGQFVAVGDPIVPLQSLDSLFVNISLPQSTLSRIAVRQKVVVTLDAFSGRLFEGMITALNTQADPVTRTISVQATIPNSDSLLRPGMFARVEIESGAEEAVLVVPLSAIAYAPYGDTVYVLEKMQDEKGVDYLGARQQIVALGTRRGDLVVVKSGLKVGEQIATSGVFKLRPRVGVLVNNQVQPSAQVNPQPEDQ